MNKVYARINWENYPSENTPLNESNLNKIDYGLNEVDNRVIELDTTKVSSSALSDNIKSWSMDEATGIITIEKYSGEKVLFDLNIEKIPVSFSLSDDGILTMTTDDGTRFTADIGSMIPVLTFNDSETIAVSVTGTGVNKTYSFSIKNGSVTGDMLEDNYLANINVKVAEAEGYANTSSTNATESRNSATLSESWAVGGTGTRDGENTNNAKYYAEQAAAVSNVEIATTEKAGIVKPDGTTITVDADGTIHGNASITVDSELSTESSNAIANSATATKFNEVDTTLSSHTEAISSLNTELTQLSNPNLLINPDFKINQRWQSEYSGYCYSVDRWIINQSGTAKVGNNGISINNNFCQVAENPNDYLGKTITLSAKIDGVVNSGTVTLPTSFSGSDATVALCVNFPNANALIIIENSAQKIHVANIDPLGNTVTVEWVKLELGSVATPFVPPDPASELLKCQRYYEHFYVNSFLNVSATDDGHYELYIPFIKKRTNPTIQFVGSDNVTIENTSINNCVARSNVKNNYISSIWVDAEIY